MIYEYVCDYCKLEFEQEGKVGDKIVHCPGCGLKRAERTISKTSFILKGEGWAADGYERHR